MYHSSKVRLLVPRQAYFFPYTTASWGIRWGMRTTSARELGHVLVSFTGSVIDAVRFEEAWPEARFREGKHFMDKRFRLPRVEGSTSVFQTTAGSDGLYWARPMWHRYFGNSVSGVLESILDGTYTVAKNGLPTRPIFRGITPRMRRIARQRRSSSKS